MSVIQEWEGTPGMLMVFGLPPERRKKANAKNYFSIYRVHNSVTRSLKCEVIFPKGPGRQELIERHDPRGMLHISSIKECEGEFGPDDYDYLLSLIDAARAQRLA